MASFDFKTWCEANGLNKDTVDTLIAQDFDTKEALILVLESDVDKLDMSLGQCRLLCKGITGCSKTLDLDLGLTLSCP